MFNLTDCNPSQREAVTFGEGPLLLLAGPGSGKTFTITKRILWLIHEKEVAPRTDSGDHLYQRSGTFYATALLHRLLRLPVPLISEHFILFSIKSCSSRAEYNRAIS